jgi:hypothetical protein
MIVVFATLGVAACNGGKVPPPPVEHVSERGVAAPTLAQVTIDTNPHMVSGAMTVTWSAIGAPRRDDIVGLYPSSNPSAPLMNFHYTCPTRVGIPQGPCPDPTPNGTMTFAIPADAAPGTTYEVRYNWGTGETAATTQPFAISSCSSPGTTWAA